MICPECDGIGIVRVRFLLFFTRRVRCSTCLGSGEFPPSAVRTSVRSRRSYRDDDDDDNRWPIATTPSTVTGADAGNDEPLEVGGGGASGGAGGGASWDASASEERDAPVIADPFASALPDEPPLERDDSSSSMRDDSSSDSFSDSSSDSPSESSGSDSGTSY